MKLNWNTLIIVSENENNSLSTYLPTAYSLLVSSGYMATDCVVKLGNRNGRQVNLHMGKKYIYKPKE